MLFKLTCIFAAFLFLFVMVQSQTLYSLDQTGYLSNHNNARRTKGMKDLVWNNTAQSVSDGWACNCQFAHNGNRGPYGENIYASYPAPSGNSGNAPAAVKSWMGEAKDYLCPDNTCNANQVCGHYTQVMWNTTSAVGCSACKCPGSSSPFSDKSKEWLLVVCDYYPAGNYIGRMPYDTSYCKCNATNAETCDSKGWKCGSFNDGCKTVNCGTCSSGTCNNGVCGSSSSRAKGYMCTILDHSLSLVTLGCSKIYTKITEKKKSCQVI